MWVHPGLCPPVVRLFHRQLRSGFQEDLNFTEPPNRPFLCSFLVTAGLQDKRAPFEPRGGPEMGKDKHQAGQRASKPTPPVVWRPLGVLVLVFPSWNRDKRGMPVPNHLGGLYTTGDVG